MKKVSLVIILLMGVLLFAESAKVTSQTKISKIRFSDKFIRAEINNESIPTGSANFAQITISDILDWDAIYIPYVTSSYGTVSTGVISWLKENDAVRATESITVGTVYTSTIKSPKVMIKLTNPSANAVTRITADIQMWND